jgi:hypothetical protein
VSQSCDTRAGRGLGGKLLDRLGTGGLTVAMNLFGQPTKATALIDVECCHLFYQPSSWSQCAVHGNYIWSCVESFPGGFTVWCQCCERSGGSALQCVT